MSTLDWKRRMREAATRLRDHYHAIGLASGAPFLGVLYPPDLEVAVLTEWRTQLGALGPDYEFVEVDALKWKSGWTHDFRQHGVRQLSGAWRQEPRPDP